MSEIMYVLKNKNKYAKEARKHREAELAKLKEESFFNLALSNDLEQLKTLFTDPDVKSVTVKIPDNFISKFQMAIYSIATKEFEWEEIEYGVYKFRQKEIIL